MILTRLRNIDSCENTSKQQLESKYVTLHVSNSESKSNSKAKMKSTCKAKLKSTSKSKAEAKAKLKSEPIVIWSWWTWKNEDSKKLGLYLKILGEWYEWLISHIPKSVKKSVSNIKEKIMNRFPKDCKQRNIGGAFDDKYILAISWKY